MRGHSGDMYGYVSSLEGECGACFGLVTSHESWNFPAGVSFALKQNMYWGGFCAFLPDISGCGGGGGGVSCF